MPIKHLFRPFTQGLMACLLLTLGSGTLAQGYPVKPIRMVVPWPPGTPADVSGRIVAEKLSGGLGQPIVVDNKPGAAGTIGMADALRQPADGYTLYLLSSASLVAPLLFPAQPLPFHQLEPVGHLAWSYNVLVAPVSSALKGPSDIVQTAKAKPGSLSFASGGNGTPAHLAGELFKQQTGTVTTHVPYNQFGLAIGDLIADRTNFMFLTASAAIPQINGGKLKPMAVTGAKRLPALKDVPTMAEQGFGDFVLRSFDGMMVKTGTPKEVVERLNTELNKALSLPDVRERLAALALETEPMSSTQFGAVIAAETEKWQRIGRAAQIKAD
ncbi:tripartite tricarboxylate transporter substrate binding protein [Limnohabitans sp. T6-5]|uniref:Bug family tripartite tricarboxylate transporter substrate binding protein n=1 Tax=Limnohabitans sp. T6-5 TaxID=1100724 RepID=UPI001304E4EF|nr:tripartite tricarboxylate transporter substrate binding protein [Limnohabitans sp. T6-5]